MIPMVLMTVLTLLAFNASVAVAQDVAADVRTWTGQALRLGSPTLDVFYTVLPPAPPGEVAAPGLSSRAGTSQAGTVTTTMTVQQSAVRPPEGYAAPQTGDSKQGRRAQNVITVTRGGVDVRVPLTSVTAITFARAPLTKSLLPPYAGADHYRYAATLDLTDGSQVAGDYVNLGTTVLRGTTPQGTVEIPWQDIQTLRFQR
jgi:hypothetical protein